MAPVGNPEDDYFRFVRTPRYNEIVCFRTVPHTTAIRSATRQNRWPEADFPRYYRAARTFVDRSTYLEAPRVSSRPSFQKRQRNRGGLRDGVMADATTTQGCPPAPLVDVFWQFSAAKPFVRRSTSNAGMEEWSVPVRLRPTQQRCPTCLGRCTNTRGSLCPICNGLGEIPTPPQIQAEVARKGSGIRERPARR